MEATYHNSGSWNPVADLSGKEWRGEGGGGEKRDGTGRPPFLSPSSCFEKVSNPPLERFDYQ